MSAAASGMNGSNGLGPASLAQHHNTESIHSGMPYS
jgi:hypothetical protein